MNKQRVWMQMLMAGWCLASAGCATESSAWMARGGTAPAAAAAQLDRQLSLARLTERQGKPDMAAQLYHAVLRRNANNQTACHRLGVIAARQGRLDEARQHLERAKQLGPSSAELETDLGYTLYLQHNLAGAEKTLRSVVEAYPGHKKASANLGLVLGEQGKTKECLAQFQRVMSDAEAHANLGFVYTQLGDLDKAEDCYHKALDINSNLRPATQALLQLASTKVRRAKQRVPDMARREMVAQKRPHGGKVQQVGSAADQRTGAPTQAVHWRPVTTVQRTVNSPAATPRPPIRQAVPRRAVAGPPQQVGRLPQPAPRINIAATPARRPWAGNVPQEQDALDVYDASDLK